MRVVEFTVPGVPVAQPRQRHASVQGRLRNYTPAQHPANVFKATVLLAARQAYKGPPCDGPVELTASFYFARPQRLLANKAIAEALPHTARPDFDNLAKSLTDPLTGFLWADDAQISLAAISKWYVAKGSAPETRVRVYLHGPGKFFVADSKPINGGSDA